MKMASWLTLIACLLFPLTVTVANAANSASSNSMAKQSSQKIPNKLKVRSREQAIQLVKRQYQGKVLKAQSIRNNGHSGYQVKLISKEGLVFYVFVDAQTGSVRRN